jgi:hypothetical protein
MQIQYMYVVMKAIIPYTQQMISYSYLLEFFFCQIDKNNTIYQFKYARKSCQYKKYHNLLLPGTVKPTGEIFQK